MNNSVTNLCCECCLCAIDESVQFQYIFQDDNSTSCLQTLILDCIGKNVTYIGRNQQVICNSCLQQLNQIKEFKLKCLQNVDEEYDDIEFLESSSNNSDSFDDCEDYEVLEDFLDNDITPLKYMEQIEYALLADRFKDIEFERTVVCSICEELLKSHTTLIRHIIKNHVDFDNCDSLYYPCNVEKTCSRFNSIKETSDHILAAHYSTSQNLDYNIDFDCLTCNTKFPNKIDFGKHVCSESNQTDLTCSVCNVEFTTQLKMNFHFQFHLENARPKICLICLIKFNTETDFYNHVMFFHESANRYQCSFCDQAFSSISMRQNHEMIHSLPQNYCCEICRKSFGSEQMLSEHTISHMHTKPFKCHICGKQLNRVSRLRKHIASHEQRKFNMIYSCEICDLSYAVENHAIEHIKSNHNLEHDDEVDQLYSQTITDHVFCCEYCSNLYRTSKYLNEHRQIHDGLPQPYECEYCSSTYDSFCKLRTHRISHEKNNDRNKFPVQKLFLCRHNCDKSYLHWPDLSHHMNMVHLAKPITCEICNKTFPYRWNYVYHKKIEHCTMKVSFVCNIDGCTTVFHRKKEYFIHKKLKHLKVKVKKKCRKCKTILVPNEVHECYVEELTHCELCGKQFQTVTAVKVHVKVVHDRVINYRCEFCNRGFYNMSDKNIHLRIHTQEKPYRCSTCSYECRTHSTLVEHIRTHTNDRPFSCPYPKCGATFRRSYAMKTHFKIHTGERFSCTFDSCTNTFRSKSQLNYHLKRKHRNLNADPHESVVMAEDVMFELSDTKEDLSVEYDMNTDLSNIIVFQEDDI